MGTQLYIDTGRMISIQVVSERGPINILGIYQGFESEGNKLIRRLTKNFINEHTEEHNIVIGDFNEIVSEIDYSANYVQERRPKGKLHTLLERRSMTDCIRITAGNRMEHSHVGMTTAGKNFARLDYIYCSNSLLESLIHAKTEYKSSIISDHMPIWIGTVGTVQQKRQKYMRNGLRPAIQLRQDFGENTKKRLAAKAV